MSQLYSSSPVRSPRPRPVDVGSPSVNGATRQANASFYRNIALPPASPKRLQFPSSQNPHTAPNGARAVVIPAAAYTSREAASAVAQARREDEEHGATQLILLLTLSVVLLTLPWVVDHPVTLLVPVALFILPITSGALRSLASEGFALISGGVRWFWRHRNSGKTHATAQSASAAAPQQRTQPPQPSVSRAYTHNPQPQARAWQPPGAYPSQQPKSWQQLAPPLSYPGGGGSVDQHARMVGMQPGNAPNSYTRAGGVSQKLEWQAVAQRPRPVVQVLVRQLSAAVPDFTTPDLEFDEDGGAASYRNMGGRARHDWPYPQGPSAQGQAQGSLNPCSQPMQQHGSAQHSRDRRVSARTRSEDQAECTVYNWDEADECTQRRGHRPLSDLLNNVQ